MKIMNRRAFVGTMGVAGATMLAGCAPEAKPAATGDATADAPEAEAKAAEWVETEKNPDVKPMLEEPAPYIYTDEEAEEILNNRAVVTTDWVNEDGTTVSPAMQMTRNTMNRNGYGMGSCINKDHQLDLWPFLFTEEQAELYAVMPMYDYFDAAQMAEACGKDEATCKKLLDEMAEEALLRRVNFDGTDKYLSLGSEYGYYEAYIGNPKFNTEYITKKDLNGADDMLMAFLDTETSMYRTMPVDLSVCIDGEYGEYDDWHAVFDRHDTFSVSPCMCRVSTLIREGKAKDTTEAMEKFNATMRDCGHNMDTCICCGENAKWQIEIGVAKEISREEAIERLEQGVKDGFIIESVYTKDAENICQCHADCCLNVGAVRMLNGGPAIDQYSSFKLMHKKEDCIKCGTCESRCPMMAITMDEEGYPIVDNACVRCGQCALVCPQGARGLKLKPQEEQIYLPQTLQEDYRLKALARIKKGYLYDITSQEDMQKIAASAKIVTPEA